MGLFSFFGKKEKEDLEKGLEKTRESVFSRIARAVAGKTQVDDEILDNLEEILINADVGVETTLRIIERIQKRVARDKYINTSELNRILREEIVELLEENRPGVIQGFDFEKREYPYVIMVYKGNSAFIIQS